jgi:hypothetical protein
MFAAQEFLRPIPVRLMGSGRFFMGQVPKPVEYGCPVTPPGGGGPPGAAAYAVTEYDPTLNCMRDARGNAICSDGKRYPPGCPHTPPDQYFTPGITPDVTTGSRIEGQQPPPRGGGSAAPAAPGGGGSVVLPVVITTGVLAALGTGAYFLFFK